MKKQLRFLFLTSLGFLWSSGAYPADEPVTCQLAYDWDVDSDTVTYPKLVGQNGRSCPPAAIAGPSKIETSGSSATVTESVSGALPFTELLVGDVLAVRRPSGAVDLRVIDAKASGASITVHSAVDWSTEFAWSWYSFAEGTAVTDGWVDTSGLQELAVEVLYEQGDLATGLNFQVECKSSTLGGEGLIVYPIETTDGCGLGAYDAGQCQLATDPVTATIPITPPCAALRVGVARDGADTSDAGAARELVSIAIRGIRVSP